MFCEERRWILQKDGGGMGWDGMQRESLFERNIK